MNQDLSGALRAAQQGDERGFAVLWRSLQPAVLRYLRVVTGDCAEDVASETWLQVSRDLGRFEGDIDGFRIWLFRIARHRGIDERRRSARRPVVPLDMSSQNVEWESQGRCAPDAAEEAVRQADTAWALALIASLPTDQAEAVMLRVVAGLDAASAGAVLGKRPGAVRVASMRGLRRLAGNVEVQARRAGPGDRAVPRPRNERDVPGGVPVGDRSARMAAQVRSVIPGQRTAPASGSL